MIIIVIPFVNINCRNRANLGAERAIVLAVSHPGNQNRRPNALGSRLAQGRLEAIGRTDLPGASMSEFMKSIKKRLLTLPEDTVVWPGHDYGFKPSSTIDLEKKTNPWLG